MESSSRELDSAIESMYDEESLKQHEYRLHAVMVHEGSVDSGHYWAYVFDHRRKVKDEYSQLTFSLILLLGVVKIQW